MRAWIASLSTIVGISACGWYARLAGASAGQLAGIAVGMLWLGVLIGARLAIWSLKGRVRMPALDNTAPPAAPTERAR